MRLLKKNIDYYKNKTRLDSFGQDRETLRMRSENKYDKQEFCLTLSIESKEVNQNGNLIEKKKHT